MAGKLKVTQTRSTISHIARNRATVKALGLHGIGSTSIVADNDATRGMVRQVRFLVTVEEITDGGSDKRSGKSTKGHAKDRSADTSRSEDRGDATASHRSEDSEDGGDAPASQPSEDSKEKTTA
jgi:large subunit ribosomal protein L30